MYRLIVPALPLALTLVVPSHAVAGGDLGLNAFVRAEQALKAGDRVSFEALLPELHDHPLYPYLRFAELTADPDAATDASIESFLDTYGDTPLAERLRPTYLKRLAAGGRWADYARVYRPDDSVERRCLYLRALRETGRREQALTSAELEPLWLSARSRPGACDPLFAAWEAAGGLTVQRVWGRIRLAMEAGETGLARFLGAKLPESERPWLERWLAVRSNPDRLLDPAALPGDHPLRAAMLATGVARLARSRPNQALEVLVAEEAALATDPAAWDLAHRAVGRALVGSDRELDRARGLRVWDRMSADADNLARQEERVRAAIRLGAWGRVADWIGRMPEGQEKGDRWLYWLARAQAALGRKSESLATLRQAAGHRSLWGFLAADRLGLPYKLDDQPAPAEPERIRRIAQHPAMMRIQALRLLGREADMRREWRTLTREMDEADLMAAAYVADVLRWHDQAIFTLARTGYWDDLSLRFPVRYRDLVAEQAWQAALPEDWIFAVIRQESVFNRTVASSAGALGLMQLMPATARQVAGELDWGIGAPDRAQILDPELNITLGSAYLARMRDRFGHVALATAAYNAGPHRVERWLPDDCTDADLWILSIPFDETRGYVERVLAYRVIYGARLGLEPVRVSDLLPPIPGRPQRLASVD